MIRFNASEIASLVGRNPYKSADEAITDCWNRHARKRGINAPKAPTFILKALKVVDNNKEVVGDLMDKIKNTANTTETSKETFNKAVNISTKINQMDLTADEKTALIDYTNSKLYTNYGTRKENKVHDVYKEMTGNTIGVVNKMFVKEVGDFEVGGKIDGQLDDGTIIEIKNRTRRLFAEVREYEGIQIQTYLHLLEQKEAHLVECYNDGEKKHVNIIEVKKNENVWNDIILPGLQKVKVILDEMFETKQLKQE